MGVAELPWWRSVSFILFSRCCPIFLSFVKIYLGHISGLETLIPGGLLIFQFFLKVLTAAHTDEKDVPQVHTRIGSVVMCGLDFDGVKITLDFCYFLYFHSFVLAANG